MIYVRRIIAKHARQKGTSIILIHGEGSGFKFILEKFVNNNYSK